MNNLPGHDFDGDETPGEWAVRTSLLDAFDPVPPGPPRPQSEDPGPCPVQPLGRQGRNSFYLSPGGRLWTLSAAEHTELNVLALFETRQDWLWKKWPYLDRDKNVVGWSIKSAAANLLSWTAQAGDFDPAEDMRGVGIWRDDDGKGLVVHVGDNVMIKDRWRKPGRYGAFVYGASRPAPRPGPAAADRAMVIELFDLLSTWAWKRPDVDPRLMLGWIACGVLCGALDWRPSVWVTAGAGSGKSWLFQLIENVLGGAALVLVDSTDAAIRQALSGAARPVMLDEFEAEETDFRAQEVVKMIRYAATRGGGKVARGSTGGKAQFYSLDAVFLCSSILIPALKSQDLQRLTILELDRITAKPEDIGDVLDRVHAGGRYSAPLRARLIAQWPRFEKTMLVYMNALVDQGHTSRSANQLGTLLAAADLLLGDVAPPAPQIIPIIAGLTPDILAGRSDIREDHEQCLSKLLSTDLGTWRSGVQHPVGEVIVKAHNQPAGEWKHHLSRTGMKFEFRDTAGTDPGWYLIVSNTHDGISRLFHGTQWGNRTGGSGRTGVWKQSLLRVPGAYPCPSTERFAGVPSRAVAVPAAALDLDYEEGKAAASEDSV